MLTIHVTRSFFLIGF